MPVIQITQEIALNYADMIPEELNILKRYSIENKAARTDVMIF